MNCDTQQKHSGVEVALSLALPRGDDTGIHHQTQLLNTLLKLRFHDSDSVFLIPNFFKYGVINKQLYRQEDLVHFNDSGTRLFASNLKHGIHNILTQIL